MKSVFSFLACALLALNASAQENKGLAYPESVISDGRFLYVTNIGKSLSPTEKDGDGFISKLSLQGQVITASITMEKLDAPKGTAIVKGVLYIADVDRIVGIELASGQKTADISLASFKTVFLNDLTVKDEHTLFVSATDIGKVFEVNLKTGHTKFVGNVKGVNGICYDKVHKRLFTCSFLFDDLQGGEIGVICWRGQKAVYEKIGSVQGAFDGIALLDAHTLIVSDWGALDHPAGFLETIDLRSKTVTKLDLPVIAGPADFYLDAKRKRVFLPVILENRIQIVGL